MSEYDMNEIVPGLYIGSASAARNITNLRKCHITHILSVEYFPLPDKCSDNFTTIFIRADDDLEQDLLSYFPHTNKFIADALAPDEGSPGETCGILVHCAMGLSRSATVVCAYLMNRYKYDAKSAVKRVREKRYVSPNVNFLEQLRKYEALGKEINEGDETFRRYRLANFSHKLSGGSVPQRRAFPKYFFSPDPSGASGSEDASVFHCSACGRGLFTISNLLRHKLRRDESSTDWRRLLKALGKEAIGPAGGDVDTCFGGEHHRYVEPVLWMRAQLDGNLGGRLHCPGIRCRQKRTVVGEFEWRGERCAACATKVAPAFRMNMAAVEKCKLLANMSGAQIK